MLDERIEFEKFINSEGFFDYPHTDELQQETSLITVETQKEIPVLSTSDYLVAFSTQSQSYCVGYVDIVNSTKLSASLRADQLSQYYEIFLNSMSKIIGKFGGKVIKNIGDCLLYYFPNSARSSEVGLTNCLDCGLAMSNAQSVITEEMHSKGLPGINYRISADYGTVIMMNTNNSSSVDLIGPPVNMCAKINHCAGNNEFVVGNDLRQFTKKFQGYEYREVQSCNVGFRSSYPVYRVTSSHR